MIEVSDYVYASSGATGDIDATASASTTAKHGIAVALNPAVAAAGGIPPHLLIPRRSFQHMLVR